LDRVRLIELIEAEAKRLSPEGREFWEDSEFLWESAQEWRAEWFANTRSQSGSSTCPYRNRPHQEAHRAADRFARLRRGGRSGEYGEEYRARGVIHTAWLKDREGGRKPDPEMTLDQALARLREHG
jgi:hypothetical protein